jgi:hypothetical protein
VGVLDVEVGHEGDAQSGVDLGVGVDRLGHGIDQLDDALGHEVAGRGLAAEDEGAGRDVEPRVFLEPAIQRHDVQQIEMLALVLVDALDLDIEEPGGLEDDAGLRADVVGETLLVGLLDRAPRAPGIEPRRVADSSRVDPQARTPAP